MSTCFLFIKGFQSEGCLSLRLDVSGTLDAPLKQRSFIDIKALQHNARTVIVLPIERSSIYRIELPKLSNAKAREAIPFVLEEQLAQPVSQLHFAFSVTEDKQYRVVVVDKSWLLGCINNLNEGAVSFDAITLDWFALQKNEVCITDTGVLANLPEFQGALQGEVADHFISRCEETLSITVFSDSWFIPDKNLNSLPQTASEWIAERLRRASFVNLCQGELARNSNQVVIRRWYYTALSLLGIWFVTLLILSGISLHKLNRNIAAVDTQIAVIYHAFFPEAKQVISPKFRVSQRLKEGGLRQEERFWPLLDKLASAMSNPEISLEQLQYQNQKLHITVLAPDFSALEQLQQRLQQAKLQIKQTQAASKDGKAFAALELNA